MAFKRKRVTLPQGTIPYFEAGTGRPVVYFHPGGGVILTKPLLELAETYKVYAPVFPGFDGTPMLNGVDTIADIAALCAAFIGTVTGEEKVDVFGHSFGGWVACHYAAIAGGKLDQIVLECPTGFRKDGEGGLSPDPERRLRQLYKYPEKAPTDERTPEMHAGNVKAIGHYYENTGTGFDAGLLDRLKGVEALALILHGTLDTVIPAATAQRLKDAFARAFLIYIYDAAHSIEVDQPERIMRAVGPFLERGEAFIVNWDETPA
jgi:pimeloyl-ACP methyl ester carboxylesterase